MKYHPQIKHEARLATKRLALSAGTNAFGTGIKLGLPVGYATVADA